MMNRRMAALGIAGAGFAVLSSDLARGADPASAGPVAKTSHGLIRGTTRDGACMFLGVPYGAATGGAARFMPPAAAAPWSGVRETTAYGPSCPQVPLGMSPFMKKL